MLLEIVPRAKNRAQTRSTSQRYAMVKMDAKFRKIDVQSLQASCMPQPTHRSVSTKESDRKNRITLRLVMQEWDVSGGILACEGDDERARRGVRSV
jgi:uncharacterized membrane-anchored protein